MKNGIKIAVALALAGFFASETVARADGHGHENDGASEAPLPLLGATPFALAALGVGGVFSLRRRRAAKA